jgi:hypothetical protein
MLPCCFVDAAAIAASIGPREETSGWRQFLPELLWGGGVTYY